MAKKKTQIPKEETPRQRFKRVVEPRVGRALKAIGLIGSVSGSAYTYADSDIATIVTALREAISKMERRFAGEGDSTGGFSL